MSILQGSTRLRIVVSLSGDGVPVGDDCLVEWPDTSRCRGHVASLHPAFEEPREHISEGTGELALMEIDVTPGELSHVAPGGSSSPVSVAFSPGNRQTLAGLALPALHAGHDHAEASPGLAIWFTGFSGAGKTTLAQALERRLARSCRVEMLDADIVRTHICKGLGFSKADRTENLLRLAFVAKLLVETGAVVLVSAISPYAAARQRARAMIPRFVEVYVNAPISLCEVRDVKGLYRKAREGKLQLLTGVDDPYEPPLAPDIECLTAVESPEESVAKILAHLQPFLGSHATHQTGSARVSVSNVG